MNQILVNGIEMEIPVQESAQFQELIAYLRSNLNTETQLISSVHVNGSELTEPAEEQLASVPLTDIRSVEIFTTQPKELADQTLRDLLPFTVALERLSIATSQVGEVHEFYIQFTQLIEGIGTFTEAILNARRILRVGIMPSVNLLEADLLSILKDLLQYQEKGETQYMAELLGQHLPLNLQQWREQGIPDLMRSRDS